MCRVVDAVRAAVDGSGGGRHVRCRVGDVDVEHGAVGPSSAGEAGKSARSRWSSAVRRSCGRRGVGVTLLGVGEGPAGAVSWAGRVGRSAGEDVEVLVDGVSEAAVEGVGVVGGGHGGVGGAGEGGGDGLVGGALVGGEAAVVDGDEGGGVPGVGGLAGRGIGRCSRGRRRGRGCRGGGRLSQVPPWAPSTVRAQAWDRFGVPSALVPVHEAGGEV